MARKTVKIGGKNYKEGSKAYKAVTGTGKKGEVLGASTFASTTFGDGGFESLAPGSTGTGFPTGVSLRNEQQENPYGYEGTKDNQFPGVSKLPPVDRARAASIAKAYNLTGVVREQDFVGLSVGDAQAKAQQMRDSRKREVMAGTSYAFNPETLSGAKKTFEGFNAKLQDTNSDPWTSKGTKKEKLAGLYESTANEFARLFDRPEDFDTLLNTDRDFAAGMEAFKRAGGDLNSVRSRIAAQPAFPVQPNEQSTADYLAGIPLNAPQGAPQADADAFEALFPERQLAQEQIMRTAQIPQQYRDLYFGTPESIGVLQEKRIQAEEQKKLIERQEKADERNIRAQADLAIRKNEADLEIEEAQIEENRLAAKNYATGMLAKLGALNTTGAAPVKLAMLEQKYQQQKQQLRTNVRFANKAIEIKMKEAVSQIELDTDQAILDIQGDLTKEKEEVLKEIQKLEATAWDKIYSITDKAAGELRTQREKYTKEAKALAEKNAKDAAKTSALYDYNAFSEHLTPTNKRDLASAGLAKSPAEVQTFFLSGTEPAFRQAWIREVALGNNKNPTIENITNSYYAWKAQNKGASGGGGSGTSVDDL